MKRDEIIAKLRAHEPELQAAGVTSLALSGSTARDGQRGDSDVDIVVRLSVEAASGGFAYFEQLDSLTQKLQAILGRPVDVLAEPINKNHLRRSIGENRIIAF